MIIGDEVRWISARGQGADAGLVDRVMFGIFLDVTGRKQAEEGNELLAGEMSHRVKNLLAIAGSLRMGVGERSASALAMVVHDLATNSVKHGALSSASGALDISGAADDRQVTLIWVDGGGN